MNCGIGIKPSIPIQTLFSVASLHKAILFVSVIYLLKYLITVKKLKMLESIQIARITCNKLNNI